MPQVEYRPLIRTESDILYLGDRSSTVSLYILVLATGNLQHRSFLERVTASREGLMIRLYPPVRRLLFIDSDTIQTKI